MEELLDRLSECKGCESFHPEPKEWSGLGKLYTYNPNPNPNPNWLGKVYTDLIFSVSDGYLIYVHGGWSGQANRGVLDEGRAFSQVTAVPQIVKNVQASKDFYMAALGAVSLLDMEISLSRAPPPSFLVFLILVTLWWWKVSLIDTKLSIPALNKVMKIPDETGMRMAILTSDPKETWFLKSWHLETLTAWHLDILKYWRLTQRQTHG